MGIEFCSGSIHRRRESPHHLHAPATDAGKGRLGTNPASTPSGHATAKGILPPQSSLLQENRRPGSSHRLKPPRSPAIRKRPRGEPAGNLPAESDHPMDDKDASAIPCTSSLYATDAARQNCAESFQHEACDIKNG